ncbi:hypothetical protein GRI42_13765 [Erythrobacter gaetbuli]|uniref:Uncharacterized protein n=1 Tax=Qipengyuania gaetbuli TaxID=266952 RepID=A0A844Y4Z3_9SPHN|nr:hypothetical protein [Qipengyuania gaetbuli]MXO52373.1 hypothetical protein [Qipengyuania gaetbuli]
MYDLPNIDALRAVLDQPLDERLKTLLADRLADTIHCCLQDYTHVLVVEAGDSEEDMIKAVGFSPLRSRFDATRKCLDCDWLEQHDGWWELLFTVGNAGFAYIVLVADEDGIPLADLCRTQEIIL